MSYLRILLIAVTGLISSAALADDVVGKITAIDVDNETVTLDNGNQYRLSSEFDFTAFEPGTKVQIIYDEVDNVRYVMDIEELPK